MLPKAVLLEGLIIGSAAGSGLADRRIEVWSLGENDVGPIAEGHSDAQGRFALDLPLQPGADGEDGIVRLEFRIFDHGDLILAEVRELVIDQGPQPIQFFLPNATPHHYRGGEAADGRHERHEVHGRVWGSNIAGANVRGVRYALRSDGSEYEIDQAFAGETPVCSNCNTIH
jgi:5-hydroxyisourate hydrolase-like protein (transthyretin family)